MAQPGHPAGKRPRMPTCKHDLSLCKRQDFKINPACRACPSSSHVLLGEEATCPRQAGVNTRSGGVHLGGHCLPQPLEHLSPEATGNISRLHSILPHPAGTSTAIMANIYTAKCETYYRNSPAGYFRQTGEVSTVIVSISHMGKLRTERFK